MHPRFELHANTSSFAAWADLPGQPTPQRTLDEKGAGHKLHPVLRHSLDHHRQIAWMSEGLVPSYACDDHAAERLTEAHAEAVTCDCCFRGALRRRRCVVPAHVLHEVRYLSPRIVHPCSFALNSDGIFGIAAVWERWSNDQGHEIESFAILTVRATPMLRGLFGRMPVILQSQQEQQRWLSTDVPESALVDLLKPLSPAQLREWTMTPEAVRVHVGKA